MSKTRTITIAYVCAATSCSLLAIACSDSPRAATDEQAVEDLARNGTPLLPRLTPTPTLVASTVPPSGDENPYGVAFVPRDFPDDGMLHPGDVLVSNFNNNQNLQGTGSTIVAIHGDGTQTVFFQGAPGLGLSTALGVMRSGFVIVGSVPSTDGSGVCTQVGDEETNVGAGALLVLDRRGNIVRTIASQTFLDGPWDLTLHDGDDRATLFVSNALSGTVTRFELAVRERWYRGHGQIDVDAEGFTQIASGYLHRCDQAAFVVGPTGSALDEDRDILYVSSTGDNEIFAIRDASRRRGDAGTGELFIADQDHLRGPLGLAFAPNGDLVSAQGDAVNADPEGIQVSELVEYSPRGKFIDQFSIDSMPGGAFGLAIRPLFRDGFVLAAVDDVPNELHVWIQK